MAVHRIVQVVNLPRYICRHMVGEQHSCAHRMGVGVVVMTAGVGIAMFGGHVIPGAVGHFMCDAIGYLVHGLGAVPFIEWLIADEAAVEAALVFPAIVLLDDEVEGLD